MVKKWWKEAVIYQVYPRSFCDSNGDGIGDLQGVISKLDYIKELGADVIWLNPCYKSPNDDNGYDISDYYDIMDDFGTMKDFEELLLKAHEKGIRVIMDLVVNHSSDEHEWFIESRSSKNNSKRDYYIWRDPKDGKEPNNWGSFFSPSAWELDEKTGQYYLHLFSVKQPDLNWENEELKEEIYKMMKFWLDKGIDGFRCDVINATKKPIGLPDSKLAPNWDKGFVFDYELYFNNDGQAELIEEIIENTIAKYDAMSVGETGGVTPKHALDYVREDKKRLNMVFQFEIVDGKENWDLKFLKSIQRKWITEFEGKGWLSQYLSNHDQPRQVSIYGDDKQYLKQSAKLLATMIHTLPGTPYIYQGEELGLPNTPFSELEEFKDIMAHHHYNVRKHNGLSHEQCMEYLNKYSRDHSRTPMPWDENYSFTNGTPWIKHNPHYKEINAAIALKDTDSVFNYYKKLTSLRKANEVMVYGKFEDLLPDDENLYVYTRTLDNVKWLIALNFSKKENKLPVNAQGELVLSNYNDTKIENNLTLRAYEAIIVRV